MTFTHLFTSLNIGSLTLPNRMLMAPLTRCRADKDHVPTALMAEHYSQRASAGLIIAEATAAMDGCSAFGAEPGIYNDAQVAGWYADELVDVVSGVALAGTAADVASATGALSGSTPLAGAAAQGAP